MKESSKPLRIKPVMTLTFSLFFVVVLFYKSAYAHHSYSIYDRTQDVSITGVLTKFDFVQPHIKLELEVTEEDGSKTSWDVETSPIISWERHGLDKEFIAIGDNVTLVGWVANSGANEMGLSIIINEDQEEMVVRLNQRGGGVSGRSPARGDRIDRPRGSDSRSSPREG